MGKLDGRVALITGAGRGLGKGMALGFAEEGAQVAVHYLSSQAGAQDAVDTIRTRGGKAEAFQAELADAAQVERLIGEVRNTFGKIDILVNNAGNVNQAPLTEMSIQQWDDLFNSHVRSMFLCTRLVLPEMIQRKYGKIIIISGSFAVSGHENFTHLSAAKAAQIGFARALAKEVGPHNIYVNCIAPAMIHTEQVEKLPKDLLDRLIQSYPLRKIGAVKDIVASALFLASSDSDFYTGQTLCPTGGNVMV